MRRGGGQPRWLRILALGALSAGQFARADEAPPRYHFEPGQVLRYDSKSRFTYKEGAFEDDRKLEITVLGHRPDGAARLLLRLESDFRQNGQASGSPTITLGYGEVHPVGRQNEALPWSPGLDLFAWLPKLPDSMEESRKGWEHADPREDTLHRYHVRGIENGVWEITDDPKTCYELIYGTRNVATFFFDATSGRVTQCDTKSSQDWGFVGEGTTTAKLAAVERRSEAETNRLAAEFDQFWSAKSAYEEAARKAQISAPFLVGKLVREARNQLAAAVETVTEPLFRSELERILKNYPQWLQAARRDALDRAMVVGLATPKWETTDLDGTPFSTESLKGKVVVLDFWYRGCGWCVRAMPQLVALDKELEGQPVAILGMNTDRVEEDARFVMDAMKLNYPTLRAEGLPQKYRIQGFPTIVLIDPAGVVRDLHVGYRRDLKEHLSARIREILGPTSPAPGN